MRIPPMVAVPHANYSLHAPAPLNVRTAVWFFVPLILTTEAEKQKAREADARRADRLRARAQFKERVEA